MGLWFEMSFLPTRAPNDARNLLGESAPDLDSSEMGGGGDMLPAAGTGIAASETGEVPSGRDPMQLATTLVHRIVVAVSTEMLPSSAGNLFSNARRTESERDGVSEDSETKESSPSSCGSAGSGF